MIAFRNSLFDAQLRRTIGHGTYGGAELGECLAAAALLAIHDTATAVAKPNSKVLAAAKACEPSARSLLQRLVQIDSGTGDVAGLSAMGGVLKSELEGLGAGVESVPAVAPSVGDNLVATLNGAGRARILLIAHMDTVFAQGTATQRPYAVDRWLWHAGRRSSRR